MALITWSDRMSVGNAAIDADHQQLLERLNALHAVVRGTTSRGNLPGLFRDLIHYTEYHFATEEKIMRLARYPDLENHKRQHDALTRRLKQFQDLFQTNSDQFQILEMFDFLSDWLMRHILREDMKLGAYLKARASGPSPGAA